MLQDRRVVVTGGAGFIGVPVVKHFLDAGATVDIIDNLTAGSRDRIPDTATLHEADIRSDKLSEILTSCDPTILLHLAALHYIPYCNEHPEETFEVNVMGTRNLMEAARELHNLDRVLYTSTAAVYPPRPGANPESSKTGPTDVYGRTKLVGEDLVELFAAETGVPAITARLFNTYGPNETNPHLIPAIIEQLRTNTESIQLGNLSPARDFVHVDDVTRAIRALVTGVDSGYRVFNVGTGRAASVREVARMIASQVDHDLSINQSPDRVRDSDRPHLEADIGRIEREIGWTPQIDLAEGLRDVLIAEDIV